MTPSGIIIRPQGDGVGGIGVKGGAVSIGVGGGAVGIGASVGELEVQPA